jgi:hypothetical protein
VEPIQQAAQALFAGLREWVSPQLWSEVVAALQQLVSAGDPGPVDQSSAVIEVAPKSSERRRASDESADAEIAETYPSPEELVEGLRARFGVQAPSQSNSES